VLDGNFDNNSMKRVTNVVILKVGLVVVRFQQASFNHSGVILKKFLGGRIEQSRIRSRSHFGVASNYVDCCNERDIDR
jgi:hypothetical protein